MGCVKALIINRVSPPMSATSRSGYASLLLGSTVAAAVWVLHQAGWLAAIDGFFYDRILALQTRWRAPEPAVLIVRAEREEDLSGDAVLKLLGALDGAGAKEIVFTAVPIHAGEIFFQAAAERGNVIFGRQLQRDPDNPERLRLAPLPDAAAQRNVLWGVVHVPPPVMGVYRWQQAYVSAGTNVLPTLEKRVSTARDSSRASPLSAPFMVNFLGGPGRMPNVELRRVLAGDLIPEIVKDKIALVGVEPGPVGLETPLCRERETMSFLEYQANALQTVVTGATLRPVSAMLSLLLLLFAGVSSLFLYQRSGIGKGARVAVGLLALGAVVPAAGLVGGGVWLPAGALVVEQAALFALTLGFKTRAAYLVLQDVRLRLLREVQERSCPEPVFTAAFWDNLASMVRQTLDVNRMLFLERLPGTTRLQEAAAYDCRFDQLRAERSLQGPPFAPAIEAAKPIAVPNVMQGEGGQDVDEAQYVCPLLVDEVVLGFWIFGITAEKARTEPDFIEVAGRLAAQLACLVGEKHRVAPRLSWLARLRAWLAREEQRDRIQELRHAADLLRQHHDVLDGLLKRITTAILVYDRFGRPLYVNEPASTLLRAENFAPHRGSALDLMQLLAREGDIAARTTLRRVNLDGAPVTMPVKLGSQEDRQFLARLYPLAVPAAKVGALTAHSGGLVCELIDTTVFSNLASLKGVVAERLGVELRDHLSAIEVSAALLESGILSGNERQSVLDAIHKKTSSCIYVINECEKYLGRDVDPHAVECHPLNPLELIDQACAQLADKAVARRVSFKVHRPHLMGHVLASKAELGQLLLTALSMLIDDAAENTEVTIEVDNSPEVSTFKLANAGFGIPNERLQQTLTGLESPASRDLQTLRDAVRWVRTWNGSLELTSAVGAGYRVVIKLRQFQLASFLSLDRV